MRTGFGGQKVVLNGGALVLPIVHEVIPVNMNTLRLEVTRGRERAIITKDRMRVDVTAEFYVRVQAAPEAIAATAQTLGQRTMQPEMLGELVEGKFVDALRTVAAEMTMEEMHEKRGDTSSGCAPWSRPTCCRTAWSWRRCPSPSSTRPGWSSSTPPTLSTPRV